MVHPGGPSVEDHLTHLVDDGGSGRVDQRAEERELDHGPLALRDVDEARYAGPVEIGERHPVESRDLGGVGRQLARLAAPHDDRRDDEARARRVVVQQPEDGFGAERETGLFPELASNGRLRTLPRVDPAAGQRPLARVRSQRLRPACHEKARLPAVVRQEDHGHRRRPAAGERDGAALERREMCACPRPEGVVEEPLDRGH